MVFDPIFLSWFVVGLSFRCLAMSFDPAAMANASSWANWSTGLAEIGVTGIVGGRVGGAAELVDQPGE